MTTGDEQEIYSELRKDIIPERWQLQNVRKTAEDLAGLHWYLARWHGVRAPLYAAGSVISAVRGVRVVRRMVWDWASAKNLWILESQAVARGPQGHQPGMSAHTEGERTRARRGKQLLLLAVAIVVAAVGWWHYLPHLTIAAPLVALYAVLCYFGKNPARPWVEPALLPQKYERITREMFTEALGSLGISAIDKFLREDGAKIAYIPPGPVRDGPGTRVALDLPPGVTVDEIGKERDKLAASLRRPLACVWPEGDQGQHPGRLVTYICDNPLNTAKQPDWPLSTRTRPFSLFDPIPFGTDERLKPVSLTLMFANLLVGSISRMGKTQAIRNVLLAAALDPLAEIHAWELKGTGDLEALKKVAHAYGTGAEDEMIAACLADLRKVHAELDKRAKTIRGLPNDICPQRKVTPQLARRKGLGLHPLVFAISECQEAFSHSKMKAEFEELCLQLIRRGPAMGIMLILETQRPDAKSLPTAITANVAMRFCLKVMDWQANDMVLGTGAFKRGTNATLFDFEEKGIGWAVGFTHDSKILKTFDIDGPAAEAICVRARQARELAGRLTGQAAGLEHDEPPQDVLGDVLAMFSAGETGLHWEVLAERLKERLPDRWADANARSVSAQLIDLRVPSVVVRMEDGTRRGCRLADVKTAMGA